MTSIHPAPTANQSVIALSSGAAAKFWVQACRGYGYIHGYYAGTNLRKIPASYKILTNCTFFL